jgi:uncharacterized protein
MSPTSNPTPWREAVRAAAYQGAQAEFRAHGHRYPGLAAYRYEHVRAVVRVALRLAQLTGADPETVEAAAWLHDVSKAHSKQHGIGGAAAARQLLSSTDFPPAKVEAVAGAIEKHVGLTTTEPVEPLEAAIVWDADKLTKLGATIVIHMSALLLSSHGEDPVTTESLIDEWADPAWGNVPIPYFHTAPARRAAQTRLQALLAFAQQARREWTAEDLGSVQGETLRS